MSVKKRFFSLLIFVALLFACVPPASSDATPVPTRTPVIQTDCRVCFSIYEFGGHNFIRIVDTEQGVVCWEDAGVVYQQYMQGSSFSESYAPVLSCSR